MLSPNLFTIFLFFIYLYLKIARCLYTLESMNLHFFFDRNFTLWHTNFSMKKLFSVTEGGFLTEIHKKVDSVKETCFCDINFFG